MIDPCLALISTGDSACSHVSLLNGFLQDIASRLCRRLQFFPFHDQAVREIDVYSQEGIGSAAVCLTYHLNSTLLYVAASLNMRRVERRIPTWHRCPARPAHAAAPERAPWSRQAEALASQNPSCCQPQGPSAAILCWQAPIAASQAPVCKPVSRAGKSLERVTVCDNDGHQGTSSRQCPEP